MAPEQNIVIQSKVKPADHRMDHRKIVNIVRKLASAPVDEQRGREALQSLIDLDSEVNEMIQCGPLSAEMTQDICLIAIS